MAQLGSALEAVRGRYHADRVEWQAKAIEALGNVVKPVMSGIETASDQTVFGSGADISVHNGLIHIPLGGDNTLAVEPVESETGGFRFRIADGGSTTNLRGVLEAFGLHMTSLRPDLAGHIGDAVEDHAGELPQDRPARPADLGAREFRIAA